MPTQHTIIIGDSRRMDDLADSSVHHIVTSPPYWQLKDYGVADQIGFNDSYESYINNLNLVWNECYRVLLPGCRMVINIGDQFARAVYYGRYKVIPIRVEIIKFCETLGFDYMGAIIWQKKTTMNTTGGATIMGSYPYPRNGIVEIDYEFILLFKKPGTPPKVSNDIKEQSALSKEQWKEYFSGHWSFGGAKQNFHIAMFPVELPKRTIAMFSFVGETVLDPFLGSGTTSLAAQLTGRNSVGYEINEEFLPVIQSKLAIGDNTESRSNLVIKHQPPQQNEWDMKIRSLPYVFQDPVQFDKKLHPKSAKFGSKLELQDQQNGQRETYYTVQEILAPNVIKLNQNMTVRLIGIKVIPDKQFEAVEFLKKKILKRQVFLKFDEQQQPDQQPVPVYLYMKNKTFVNAHLLKNGLCKADDSYEYKYKRKFETICEKINS